MVILDVISAAVDSPGPLATIYQYLSPFIAALAAAWLAYRFDSRRHQNDLLASERLLVFKRVQLSLNNVRYYCQASIGEIEGGDFRHRLEDLPEGCPRSALGQKEAFLRVRDESQVFFSRIARQGLNELLDDLSMAASMELAAASDSLLLAITPYQKAIEQVETCVERLYADLNFTP